MGRSPRSRTRSPCGLLHCPTSSQPAISSVSARNPSDRTASCARVSAAARCCVRSRERVEIPCNRECRRFTGATARVTSTSRSRAGPSSPVNHLSCSLSAAVCGSCRIVQTIKSAGQSELFERDEWESEINGAMPDPRLARNDRPRGGPAASILSCVRLAGFDVEIEIRCAFGRRLERA